MNFYDVAQRVSEFEFKTQWRSFTEEQKQKIRDKAKIEHISLMECFRDYKDLIGGRM
jgi:hypothetical protein